MVCSHLESIRAVKPYAPSGGEEYPELGDRWARLRLYMTCGHVVCCDSPPNKHTTAHFHATADPIIRSVQPGETWMRCYVDRVFIEAGVA
ncbi:MAG TPA: UBP-type zinc finger domain-containing protein [Candidatus Dormibacteraeota bacterium]|nr:UBP-type zinc finger domain-containing protein [Candidatus Dormibacteraeota bacterium]